MWLVHMQVWAYPSPSCGRPHQAFDTAYLMTHPCRRHAVVDAYRV